MADKSEKPWLQTRLIIEIVGFPESHINETLRLISGKFGAGIKEIKVKRKAIREGKQISIDPKKPNEESKFFSGFVEIEADVAHIDAITGIIFDWMPASIEIVEPELTTEKTSDLNHFLNDLCARLHQYDSTLKMIKAQNAILEKKLSLFQPPQNAPEDSGESKE